MVPAIPPFSCRLCGSREHHSAVRKDSKSGEALTISRCLVCSLVQQTAMPTDEELRIYYSHNYRTDYKKTYEPLPKHVRRAGLTAIDRLRFLSAHLPTPRPRTLLDIGAGGGEFVYMAERAGFDARGIEPNEGYSSFAKSEYGVDISTMGLSDLPRDSADLVTMFHVFEHLAHPQSAIERIADVLSPGGHLMIEVPNILQKDASPHNIYFKAHLFYFSRHTLTAAASRWFEPVAVEDAGNLKVLFRRRDVAVEIALPAPDAIADTERRLSAKGWTEYLTQGGGLIKPFLKLRNTVVESRLSGKSAKAILDGIFESGGLYLS